MKICVLDGYTTYPDTKEWKPLTELGDVTIYDRTATDEIIPRAKDAEIVLTNKVPLTGTTMDDLPKLRFICVLATGYNIVEIDAARKRGIIVANIPAYSTMSVAQMAFSHILNITNNVAHYAKQVADGRWASSRDFCFWDAPYPELAGKTMGIVGLGNTGMATARIALAFGMKVIALTSKRKEQLPDGITPAPIDDVLSLSDVISLHCPLTDSTRNIINAEAISKMKTTAIVINTGRGPLVNEVDMAKALHNNRIAAFGADVLSTEPPTADNPLLSAPHCYITPHIAWASTEARHRLLEIAVENVRQYINGEKVKNQVNQ